MKVEEPALEPERSIIDPHLHLWEIRPSPGALMEPQRFLLPELLKTLDDSGHKVTHTVFVECHAMYRQEGPPELRSLGETEFANGVAAMSASGAYGACRVAHRIVGHADLRMGTDVAPILEAHVARAGERFRGVRCNTAFSEAGLFGAACDPAAREALTDPTFHAGARVLAALGLSLDVWCLHAQLDDLAALADAVPELTIVLDHVGAPDGRAGNAVETRADWARRIGDVARRPNLHVKLGGLGMDLTGPVGAEVGPATSEELAARWRPYLETCIEAFSPRRCMFESNFPPDQAAGSYGATWNAFKLVTRAFGEAEKDWLFRRTAAEVYRISLGAGA